MNVDPTHDEILSDLLLYNVESFDNRKLYSSDYPYPKIISGNVSITTFAA